MPPASAVRHVARTAPQPIDQPAVRDLVALLLRGEREALHAHLDHLLKRGLPVEHVFLRLFQPAARHLGELWADDICSFVDVTLASALLQSGLRRLAARFQRHGRAADGTRAILLATLDGDQHTFGLSMVAEFFRRGGWSVQCVAGGPGNLVHHIGHSSHTVVGLSVSRADQLSALASAIRQVRRCGRDRVAGVLVGGPIVLDDSDRALDAGADAVGSDARQALVEAEALVSLDGGCR